MRVICDVRLGNVGMLARVVRLCSKQCLGEDDELTESLKDE